ncbi:MAG: hypothetical protein ABFC77_06210 [Thermoguttaceae bacterium]
MKCCICQKTIKPKEPRQYATVKGRKRYACMDCTEAFDRMIDTAAAEDEAAKKLRAAV